MLWGPGVREEDPDAHNVWVRQMLTKSHGEFNGPCGDFAGKSRLGVVQTRAACVGSVKGSDPDAVSIRVTLTWLTC
jgi:hypothetical protein